MTSKSFISAAFPMFLGFVLLPFFGGRAMAQQTSLTIENNQGQSRVGTEMISHQHLMEDLLALLQKDFQTVVASKDANGYVHDKAAVKAYKAELEGLRDAVRQHRLFAANYERWCGPDKKQNAMAEHQQRMKGILCDLSETFDTYVAADNHSIEGGPDKIEDALAAHRDALNDFANAIQDHEQAMTQMTAHASNRGSL